jgi:hypothetical protein
VHSKHSISTNSLTGTNPTLQPQWRGSDTGLSRFSFGLKSFFFNLKNSPSNPKYPKDSTQESILRQSETILPNSLAMLACVKIQQKSCFVLLLGSPDCMEASGLQMSMEHWGVTIQTRNQWRGGVCREMELRLWGCAMERWVPEAWLPPPPQVASTV